MAFKATVAIENGVFIGPTGYISVVRNGKLLREYLTPREDGYVKYWRGEGPSCIGVQEFTAGSTDSSGWGARACQWPSGDKIECARYVAKRWRMKFLG
jgi:hypothetical protein